MSYILDALRKAESERERGRVPGVHAQPGFGGGVPVGPRASGGRGGAWIVSLLAAVLVLGGILVWLLVRPSPPVAIVAAGGTAPAPATSFPSTAPAPATTSPPASAPTLTPTPTIAPANVAAAPQAELPRRTRTTPQASASAVAPATASSKTAPRSPEAASAPRVLAFGELPDELKRQLPALAVGGSVYSPVPANRMVILNGQVLHEGENVAPDLLLQQIKLKAAVLSFRGTRFELAF